jgi:hypothetical protein
MQLQMDLTSMPFTELMAHQMELIYQGSILHHTVLVMQYQVYF